MKVTMWLIRALPKKIKHCKVAAYCRVSTQREMQRYNLD